MSSIQEKAARDNWARYLYVKGRGHIEYTEKALRLEQMYLGGGEQWSREDRETLEDQGRMPLEFNEIMPGVNSAIGYQIANRMDISFKPRSGASDQEKADIRSKVAMQIADNNQLHWRETEVFADGLIQQRGYFDLRMSFDDSILGELRVDVLDPMDVMPDPDAKSYDPDGWSDVVITRWLTLDDIEGLYGADKRKLVSQTKPDDRDFGDADDTESRNKFGTEGSGYDNEYDAWRVDTGGTIRVRVVDRQRFVMQLSKVAIYPTGDVRLAETLDPETLAAMTNDGVYFTKRVMKRVKWTVSTQDVVLFDDFSPFPFLTVVPFFPYFRRGKTRGMVDNAIGPQEALNKLVAQYVHIINTTANSGWQVEENSLTNMTTDELEIDGAKTGLVQEFRQGSTPPKKIEANQVPNGVDRMIERVTMATKDVTVPEAMRGINSQEVSGVAIQSRQFAAQQQLAVPLDSLARTRNILARRIDWVITNFYDSERVFRITDTNPLTGKEQINEVVINEFDPMTGNYLNDMTAGEYDVVVTEQPMQVTFENSQFQQVLEMRKVGVSLPDKYVIKYSNLTDKQEIMETLDGAPQSNPLEEAKAELAKAQAMKTHVETVAKRVEAMYSATQAAINIAASPQVSTMSDALLRSSGFDDQDAAPIVPELQPGVATQPPVENTNPMTPANPAVGLKEGIEAPGVQL